MLFLSMKYRFLPVQCSSLMLLVQLQCEWILHFLQKLTFYSNWEQEFTLDKFIICEWHFCIFRFKSKLTILKESRHTHTCTTYIKKVHKHCSTKMQCNITSQAVCNYMLNTVALLANNVIRDS